MNLPSTTNKQQEIIKLLYRHRFLERKQIQQYFNHVDKRRSSRWLKDLKDKLFIGWIYDADPTAVTKSTPAIYFLSINGIRLLRELGYPEEELRKRYKDNNRQQDFITQSLLLADCCLHLKVRNSNSNNAFHYDYAVEADYENPDNDFFFLSESEYIHPNLVFAKTQNQDGENITQTYFVELFALTTPRYMVKKKIKNYIEYLQSDEWEQAGQGEEFPVILFACPNLNEMIYAKRYAKRQLYGAYDDVVPEEIKLRVSTVEKLKAKGVTAVIWEDV